ncbi:hypothetical protein ND861_09635 [Leptospira sp. 2 VSF19]|uniref:Uracil-DNA glycosylase-like domain-containing protein n=1 Tax=Leptospira soteropolitanensis TaxID=2950025 RepID=A0AAW5VJS7_9LEPT|nr:hypothetical protein [Leptospira soteropolitanensis]MCW7492533.1 hypothetical protein [Leptospira soteropolitanensis]MCW7500581.1 hypothetical protein [Leptospira soteropolitanensis]MCW7522749.1 hypothetical protein [Leptospira soteropolitanensis]MCW7526605.1 hypothetical protein [Leptospira soteropolitanensis]MCW7530551.1 hypothetical protein [Leptospira soteropolitanensis]
MSVDSNEETIFTFWNSYQEQFKADNKNIHPDDEKILESFNFEAKPLFNFEYPPGPYFGPLEKSKLIFLYGNPGVDTDSKEALKNQNHLKLLYDQLSGSESYPSIPGWVKWYSNKFNNLLTSGLKESQKSEVLEKSKQFIAVFNIIPYASENMDQLNKIENCLKSSWLAQKYLRETLIPEAKSGKRMIVVCRSSHLWGLRSNHGIENIIMNKSRNGIDSENIAKIRKWYQDEISVITH